MSTARNSVMMIGFPTKPYIDDSGTANFKLAVRDSVDPQKTYTFDCVGLGAVAQRIVSKVTETRLLAIDGALRCYDYQDQNGQNHTHTEIVICDFFQIDRKD